MKLTIVGKNVEVGNQLREVAESKLSKLNKYFHEDITGDVLFRTQRQDKILEVTIHLPDGTVLRSEQKSDDMFTSIDKTVAHLDRQIRKHKTKLQKRYKNNDTIRFDRVEPLQKEEENDDSPKIAREKSFFLRPMKQEEAMLQMELVTHDFFIYLDADTNEVCVLYKRGDGDLGLIRTRASI